MKTILASLSLALLFTFSAYADETSADANGTAALASTLYDLDTGDVQAEDTCSGKTCVRFYSRGEHKWVKKCYLRKCGPGRR